jgi:tetratricopeptide (TPR) repeat protein
VRGALPLLLATVLGATPAPAAEPSQNEAAWLAFQRRDFKESERLAREAWTRAEAERDSIQAATAAANLGASLALRGRLDQGLEWSRRAEERLGSAGGPRILGRVLVAQAILLRVRGEEEESAKTFLRAGAALGKEDVSLRFIETLVKGYDWEDLHGTFQRMQEMSDAARASKDPARAAPALLVLGWLQGVGGDQDSLKRFEEARALLVSSNEKATLPLIDHNIGSVLLWADRLNEAQKAYERGLAAARAASDRRMEVILLDDLGVLFSQKEDWPRAIAADREASERLGAILEDVKQGRLDDSLLLDLRRLVKGRYTHKPQLLIDLFLDVFDQLAIDPSPAAGGK